MLLNFSTETGKLGTNDIETYVPVGEKPSSLSNDAIHEEESETANCETGSAAAEDNFKHPATTVCCVCVEQR